MCSALSLRKRNATSFSSSSVLVGIAREADRVEQQRRLVARGGRTGGDVGGAPGRSVWKYGRPQATVTPSPSGVDANARRRASASTAASDARASSSGPSTRDLGRDHLVMPRRHDDLDALLLLDAHAVDQVLLRRRAAATASARRRVGELVDELVDPRRAEGGARGSADEQLLPRELIALAARRDAGRARATMRSRLLTTLA